MCMTWSEVFSAYLLRRYPNQGAKLQAAFALRRSFSSIHYWCQGSYPRHKTREQIERWSKGEVRADLPRRPRPSNQEVAS